MDYTPESVQGYAQRLRKIGFLADDEVVVGVEDDSQNYTKSGQVFWWKLSIELQNGTRRTYVLKCPYDTFGDGIASFVSERAQRSQTLRDAGVKAPRIGVYERGTFIHEYVEGNELGEALRHATPGQRESLLRQRADIVKKCEELGLVLMDDHLGNFIVNPEGEVVLLDLDLNPKR